MSQLNTLAMHLQDVSECVCKQSTCINAAYPNEETYELGLKFVIISVITTTDTCTHILYPLVVSFEITFEITLHN